MTIDIAYGPPRLGFWITGQMIKPFYFLPVIGDFLNRFALIFLLLALLGGEMLSGWIARLVGNICGRIMRRIWPDAAAKAADDPGKAPQGSSFVELQERLSVAEDGSNEKRRSLND